MSAPLPPPAAAPTPAPPTPPAAAPILAPRPLARMVMCCTAATVPKNTFCVCIEPEPEYVSGVNGGGAHAVRLAAAMTGRMSLRFILKPPAAPGGGLLWLLPDAEIRGPPGLGWLQ